MIKRVLQGVFANLFGVVGQTFVRLIGVPLFVAAWGTVQYGEWLILMAIPAYVSFSDFGFASAGANKMTIDYADGRSDDVYNLFNALFWAINAWLAVLSVPLFCLIWWVDISGLLGVETITEMAVKGVVACGLLNVVFSFSSGVFVAGFRAIQKYPLGTLLENIFVLLQQSLVLLVIFFDGGMVEAALILMSSRLLMNGVHMIVLRSIHPPLRIGVPANLGMVKPLLSPGMSFVGLKLGDALVAQGLTILVGKFFGAHTVVLFDTVRMLFNFIQKGVNLLTHSLWPEMSMMLGSNHLSQARRVLVRTTLLCGAGAAAGAVFLFLFGPAFYTWWTDQALEWNVVLAAGLGVVAVFKSLWAFQGITIISVNRHGRWAIQYMTTYVIMLLIFGVLTRHYGLSGLVATMIGAELLLYGLSFMGQRELFADLEREARMSNVEVMAP